MADLFSTYANAYRYNPNSFFEGAEGVQNMMNNALNYQQKREAMEAQRSLRDLYANNPRPAFEDIARISPEFAMQQQLSNVDLQGKMLGMQKTQGDINEQQAKIFANVGAQVAEKFADAALNGRMTPELTSKFHTEMGSALADVEKQYGFKPPPGFNVEVLDPIGVLQRAAPYYKSPTLDVINKVQGEAMVRELPRTEGGPAGTRVIAGVPRGFGVTGYAPPGVNQPQGAQSQMPADLMQIAQQAAATFNVDPNLVMRVMQAESGGNRGAVSSKGAIGPMQLMPDTARELGVDPNDVQQNIYGGVRYLAQQLQKYKDPELALAAYNAGPGAVDRAGGVPNYPETRNYVNKITGGAGKSGGYGGAPGIVTPEQELEFEKQKKEFESGLRTKERQAEIEAETAATGQRKTATIEAEEEAANKKAIDSYFRGRPPAEVRKLVQESIEGDVEAGVAKLAKTFGVSVPGGTATAQLEVITQQLAGNSPYAPGSQSDIEYKARLKKIGDPASNEPVQNRLAALNEFFRDQEAFVAQKAHLSPEEILDKVQKGYLSEDSAREMFRRVQSSGAK